VAGDRPEQEDLDGGARVGRGKPGRPIVVATVVSKPGLESPHPAGVVGGLRRDLVGEGLHLGRELRQLQGAQVSRILERRPIEGQALVAGHGDPRAHAVADPVQRVRGSVERTVTVAMDAAQGAAQVIGISGGEEHTALHRLAHDLLDELSPHTVVRQRHPDLGASRDGVLDRRRHRPGAAVEGVEGDPAPVGPARRRRLAGQRLDAHHHRRVLADPSQVAQLDPIRETRRRLGEAEPRPLHHARPHAGQGEEEEQRQRQGERRGEQRGAREAGRDGRRHRARHPVDQQGPGRRHHEGREQREEEDAVREVRREDHLEQRERDEQELGATRSGVEQLQTLGEGREMSEGDGGGIAPERDDEGRHHDEEHPQVESRRALLPGVGSCAQGEGDQQQRDLQPRRPDVELARDPERRPRDPHHQPRGGGSR
jgi:hypothetical protein